MVKKTTKKTATKTKKDNDSKKTATKKHTSEIAEKESKEKKMNAQEREDLLIENFVGLQHAMTNMSIKFGELSNNISKLLQVFEESAKNFISGGKSDDQDMLKKIDSLLNQNKTIAKGLVLMEGKLRVRAEEPQKIYNKIETPSVKPRPLPRI